MPSTKSTSTTKNLAKGALAITAAAATIFAASEMDQRKIDACKTRCGYQESRIKSGKCQCALYHGWYDAKEIKEFSKP